jgi:hypothetical protein
MATIINRFTLCLTKENQRQLDELCEAFGENKNQVLMRALQILHNKYALQLLHNKYTKWESEQKKNNNHNEKEKTK